MESTGEESSQLKQGDPLLIELVSQFPCLYNKQLKEYRNHPIRDTAWQTISHMMNMTPAECSKRWGQLRDNFARERRKREEESRSGSGLSQRRGFSLYEDMRFLECHVQKRRTYSNVQNSSNTPMTMAYSSTISAPVEGIAMPTLDSNPTWHLIDTGLDGSTSVPSIASTSIDCSLDTTMLESSSAAGVPQHSQPTSSTPPLLQLTSPPPAATPTSLQLTTATPPPCFTLAPIGPATMPSTSPATASTPSLFRFSNSQSAATPTSMPPVLRVTSTQIRTTTLPRPPHATTTTPLPETTQSQQTLATEEISPKITATTALSPPRCDNDRFPRHSASEINAPSHSRSSTLGFKGSSTSFSAQCRPATEATACYNKKLERQKKTDPIESSFMSLSSAIQDHLMTSAQTEAKNKYRNEKDATIPRTDQAFANLIAAELENFDDKKRASKKAKILKVLYDED